MSVANLIHKKAPSINSQRCVRTARERVVGVLECGDGGVREAVRTHLRLERRKVARHRELLAGLRCQILVLLGRTTRKGNCWLDV